jgi:hypothetical protein
MNEEEFIKKDDIKHHCDVTIKEATEYKHIDAYEYKALFEDSLNVIAKLIMRLEKNQDKQKRLFAFYKDVMFYTSNDILDRDGKNYRDKKFKYFNLI